MDKSLLIVVLKRLHNNDLTFCGMFGGMGIVGFAKYVALQLWVDKHPEDDDTRELRRQLQYLQEHGIWDFNK